jgi:undecaprenyl-diphosphatase
MKLALDRARPDAAQVDVAHVFGGPSFPSGHVLGTTLLLGWLFYSAPYVIRNRPLCIAAQALCVAGVLLMGLSRMDMGAHWPTDVAGAYLVAILMLQPMIALDRRLRSKGTETAPVRLDDGALQAAGSGHPTL